MTLRYETDLEEVEPKRKEEELALQSDTGRHSLRPVRQDSNPGRYTTGPVRESSPGSSNILQDDSPGRQTFSPVRYDSDPVQPISGPGQESSHACFQFSDDPGPGRQNLSTVRHDPDPVRQTHEVGRHDPIVATILAPMKKKKDPPDSKYRNFVKLLKSLQVTIHFNESFSEMPTYARYLKNILSNKQSISDFVHECYAIFMPNHYNIHSTVVSPNKLKDPGRFAITIGLGNQRFKALCGLGASASLLPLSIWNKLNMGELSPVNMKIYMADGSCTIPSGFVEDIPIQLGKFFVPDDFVIADIREDEHVPIILGRPFLATVGTKIDVREGRMTFDTGGEVLEFKIEKRIDPP